MSCASPAVSDPFLVIQNKTGRESQPFSLAEWCRRDSQRVQKRHHTPEIKRMHHKILRPFRIVKWQPLHTQSAIPRKVLLRHVHVKWKYVSHAFALPELIGIQDHLPALLQHTIPLVQPLVPDAALQEHSSSDNCANDDKCHGRVICCRQHRLPVNRASLPAQGASQ